MEYLVLGLLNGVAFAFILFLLASGLSLTYGAMGILNLAHGALFMVGTYIGWTIAVHYSLNFWLAVLLAGVGVGLIGLFMERVFLRHLYWQLNNQVLLTFGFIYILRDITRWIWGSVPKIGFTAPFLSGTFNIMSWTYPWSRIAAIFIGIIIALGLWWLLERTRTGAIIRAGMDNEKMTLGLGINYRKVSVSIFCLGAFLAGAAGVLGACMFAVTPELAMDTLLYAIVIVIVGGLGSVRGALLGCLVIGIIHSLIKGLSPDIGYFSMYLIMVVVLLIKPVGLLGKKT